MGTLSTAMSALADAIREKAGVSSAMTIAQMTDTVEGIQTGSTYDVGINYDGEIGDNDVKGILSALNESGGTCDFPDGTVITDDKSGTVQGLYDTATGNGWTISNLTIKSLKNLTFVAEQANSTVQLKPYGSADAISLKYKVNGGAETDYTISDTITLENVGDKVEFYGDNDHFGTEFSKRYYFVMSGRIAASGNVMSLMGFSDTCTNYCFYGLFSGCTALTQAPELPAKVIGFESYYQMFKGCNALTQVPELPATALGSLCYVSMFEGCSSLTGTPELPATTLGYGSYQRIFANTSINSIIVHFTSWDSTNTSYWLVGVNPYTGTFYCPAALPDQRGSGYIPSGWTKVDI